MTITTRSGKGSALTHAEMDSNINELTTRTGNLTVEGTFYETSAAIYKDNITNIPSQLNNILSLRPVEYDKKLDGTHEIGLIADEVAKVYPNMVHFIEGKPEALNYSKMVSVLVKAVQELIIELKELKSNG